jgi:hypothetical protein
MKTLPRVSAPALAMLLLAASCATAPPANAVAAVASDTATLIADITAAANGQPLTAAELQVVAAQTGKLSADVAALNAGTAGISVASVLADVDDTITEVGPFLPTILALVSLAAPAPGAPASKPMADYQQLKIDVAKASQTAAIGGLRLALAR